MPPAPPRDEGHLARELPLRGGQGELVALQRPVLDVVGILGRQRRIGGPRRRQQVDHGHGAVRQVPADQGGGLAAARGQQPHPGPQQDPRHGGVLRKGRLARSGATGEFGRRPFGEGRQLGLDPLPRAPLQDQGDPPGMHEVVRAGGPLGGHRQACGVGEEGQGLWRVVEAEDHTPRLREASAQPGEGLGERGPVGRGLGAARGVPVGASGLAQKPLGLGDGPQRLGVTGLRAVAPGDQAVLGQQHHVGLRTLAQGQGHLAREGEAGAAVGDPDRPLAVDLLGPGLALRGRAEGDDRVWVGVVDVAGREEGVQQGFDRRPRAARVAAQAPPAAGARTD